MTAAILVALSSPTPVGLPNGCTTPPASKGDLLWAQVVRVVDGDTVRVRIQEREERVRLLGVDAPERSISPRLDQQSRRWGIPADDLGRWGRLAAAYARRRLSDQRVGLELDVQERDEFGRLLAYVWLGRVLFNLELVREGYAWVYLPPPNLRYAEQLSACQREAQRSRRGLWGP